MNGVQTRFKCKLDVKRCKRFVFPPSSLLPRSNALKTKAIRYFQTDRTLTRIVSPPLRAASFQIGAATDNLHQVSDHVNLEVQTARVSLSQAMEQVQLTRNSLEKARKNEQMALERYTEGKVSIVEMIEAQNYRQISQTNYVQAKVSAQGHYSALLKALNKY